MGKEHEQGQDSYRFVIISIYLLLSLLVGVANNPLSPVTVTAMLLYNVGGSSILFTTSIFQISYACFSIPAALFVNRYGVRIGAIIGAFFLSIGFTLRILINQSLVFVSFGQGLAGVGGPFINCIQAKLLDDWFTEKDRSFWINITSFIPVLGNILGFLTPVLFLGKSENVDFDAQRKSLFNYMLFEAIISVLSFLLAVSLWVSSQKYIELEDEGDVSKLTMELEIDGQGPKALANAEPEWVGTPKEPLLVEEQAGTRDRSRSSLQAGRKNKFINIKDFNGFWPMAKICITSSYIRPLVILQSWNLCLHLVRDASASSILTSFNFSQLTGPIFVAIYNFSGVIGTVIYSSCMLYKPKQYKNMFVLTALSGVISIGYTLSLIYTKLELIVYGFGGVLGLVSFNLNVLAVYELNRKLPPDLQVTATAVTSMTGQLISAGMIYLVGFFVDGNDEYFGSWVNMAISIATVGLFLYAFCAEYELLSYTRTSREEQKKKAQLAKEKEKAALEEAKKQLDSSIEYQKAKRTGTISQPRNRPSAMNGRVVPMMNQLAVSRFDFQERVDGFSKTPPGAVSRKQSLVGNMPKGNLQLHENKG